MYFADFNQLNQHVIKYYDVNTKQEHEIFCTNKEFAHFLINSNNKIVVKYLDGSNDDILNVDYDYNFLETKDIFGLKANLEINKLWFSNLIIGNTNGNISLENFKLYFNQLAQATNLDVYDELIYSNVINFIDQINTLLIK